MLLLLSLLIPLAVGLILTTICFPPRRIGPAGTALHISLAVGIGLGVTSCLYFLAMLPAGAGVVWGLDAALAVILCTLGLILYRKGVFRKEGLLPHPENIRYRYRRIFPALFCGALISALISIGVAVLQEPHGKWDAWVIWNLHARFILRGGDPWRELLAACPDWSHPDYPLLIPLSVVRLWKYAGTETLLGPVLLSLLFTLAVIGLLVFALRVLRSPSQGWLAGLMLLGSPYFLDLGAAQFADIPLAFFFLATLTVFYLHDSASVEQDYPLLLAGLTAALAAWTKNEGLLFFLIILAVRPAFVWLTDGWRRALRQTGWFLAGALPVLAVVALFKMQPATASDLFASQSLPQMIDKATDVNRISLILVTYLQTALTFTQGAVNIRTGFHFNPAVAGVVLLAAYMFLSGLDIRRRDRSALFTTIALLMLMPMGYFGIYLITPHDLRWHLLTSLNRLFIQLWPAALLLCFMIARTPEQALVRSAISDDLHRPRVKCDASAKETERRSKQPQKRHANKKK